MTLASTNSLNPPIDVIVKDAMVLAGLMHPQHSLSDHNHKDLASWCRRALSDIVTELMANGVVSRWTEFKTLTLTAGTSDYTLDIGVQDVLGSLMYKRSPTSAETVITQIPDDDWHRLAAKDSDGVPTRVLVYSDEQQLLLRFWPIPDVTSATVSYRAHAVPRDMDDGSLCLDMPVYWRNYLKHRVAADVSDSQGMDAKAGRLYAKAQRQFRANMNKGQSRAAKQAMIGHGNFSRRTR